MEHYQFLEYIYLNIVISDHGELTFEIILTKVHNINVGIKFTMSNSKIAFSWPNYSRVY